MTTTLGATLSTPVIKAMDTLEFIFQRTSFTDDALHFASALQQTSSILNSMYQCSCHNLYRLYNICKVIRSVLRLTTKPVASEPLPYFGRVGIRLQLEENKQLGNHAPTRKNSPTWPSFQCCGTAAMIIYSIITHEIHGFQVAPLL